jgi:hypothetical protein
MWDNSSPIWSGVFRESDNAVDDDICVFGAAKPRRGPGRSFCWSRYGRLPPCWWKYQDRGMVILAHTSGTSAAEGVMQGRAPLAECALCVNVAFLVLCPHLHIGRVEYKSQFSVRS